MNGLDGSACVQSLVAMGIANFALLVAIGAQERSAPVRAPEPQVESAREQDPQPVRSGPAVGAKLPACAVYAPSGPFAGRDFDAAQQVGKAPAVLLFVHELTRNVAPLITGLDQLAGEFAWTGLQAHTIRIAADRNEAEAAVKRSSNAMRLQRAMLVSTDGVDGPGGYALHRQATLTLVLAKDGVVVRSVAFTDTGRADLPRLRKLLEEVAGPVPTDPVALREAMQQRLTRDPEQLRQLAIELALLLQRARSANQAGRNQAGSNQAGSGKARAMRQGRQATRPQGQTRPPANKQREGGPPEDAQLMALLRRAIQKAADQAELDAVFAAVVERVGEDVALRKQAVSMFKLQVSLEYGNEDSRRRAQAYVDENGSK
jgi:hypothetical protein